MLRDNVSPTISSPPAISALVRFVDAMPLALAVGVLVHMYASVFLHGVMLACALVGLYVVYTAAHYTHGLHVRRAGWLLLAFSVGYGASALQQWRVSTPMLEKNGLYYVEGEVTARVPTEKNMRLLIEVHRLCRLPPKKTPTPVLACVPDAEIADPPRYIRVSLRKNATDPPMPGSSIAMRVGLFAPSRAMVPDGFDFERYFAMRSIGAIGYSMPPMRMITPETSQQHHLERARLGIHEWFLAELGQPAGSIAAALITGDTTSIPDYINEAFRDASLAHILAISGMNLAIVCGLFFAIIRFFLIILRQWVPHLFSVMDPKRVAAVLSLLWGLCYLAIADFAVSATRAYIMVGVMFVAIMLRREALTLRSLSIAACIILLYAPSSLREAGFQLSFAATLVLICSTRWMMDKREYLLGSHTRNKPWLQPILWYPLAIMLTSLLATLVTTPLVMVHFQRIQLYGVLSNLLVLPIISLAVMPALLAAVILWPLSAIGLSAPALWVAKYAIYIVVEVAVLVASWPGASVHVPPLPEYTIIIVSSGILVACLAPRIWKYAGVVLVLTTLACSALYTPPVILASEDARYVAVYTKDGWVLARGGAVNNFTVKQWVEYLGQPITPNKLVDTSVMQCDAHRCIVSMKAGQVWVRQPYADVPEACKRVLVTYLDAHNQPECEHPKRITYPQLDKDGVQARW